MKKNSDKKADLLKPANDKNFQITVLILLFLFGVYHSILFFGHQAVPNSDFPCFIRLGRELFSLTPPSSYKRAPVLGLLQVAISYLMPGSHPELTAGWLLNAILHPFNIILLYLVGKKIVGRIAAIIAVIAIINPWIINLLTHPIAETTFLFFILLTIYLIFNRSGFAYLAASITTMVRYEGAALILIAFALDMLTSKNNKLKTKTFLYAAFASLPLALWMLATFMNFRSEGATHYLNELGAGLAMKHALFKYIYIIWQTGFGILVIPAPSFSKDFSIFLTSIIKFFIAANFVFGSIYAIVKRNKEVIVLLCFFLFYSLAHILHSFIIPRFCSTVIWIPMMICVYSLRTQWKLITSKIAPPKPLIISFRILLLIPLTVWIFKLIPLLSQTTIISPVSGSFPYVTILVLFALLSLSAFYYKARHLSREILIFALTSLMVISNQFMLARLTNDGRGDIEFKKLTQWYTGNAYHGEKMLSTMSGIMGIFAPDQKQYFLHTSIIKADSPKDFYKKCRENNITYIAWDSRIGCDIGGRYYKIYKLENIAMLAKPQSIGPYEYITTIYENNRRFVNIFRVRSNPPIVE